MKCSCAAAGRRLIVLFAVLLSISPLYSAMAKKVQLSVELNNPFDPSHQVTRFKYSAPAKDRRVKLCIFTVSGQLVRDFGEERLTADTPVTRDWNGTNTDGEIVVRGIYLVNLQDLDEGNGVTVKVLVTKQ